MDPTTPSDPAQAPRRQIRGADVSASRRCPDAPTHLALLAVCAAVTAIPVLAFAVGHMPGVLYVSYGALVAWVGRATLGRRPVERLIVGAPALVLGATLVVPAVAAHLYGGLGAAVGAVTPPGDEPPPPGGAPHRKSARERMAERVRRGQASPATAEEGRAAAPRPTIDLAKPYDLAAHIDAAWTATVASAVESYARGTAWVRLLRDPSGAAVADTITPHAARELLARSAEWVHTSQSRDGEERIVPDYPPTPVAQAMIATVRRVPALRGIVQSPVYTAGGRLVVAPGYDTGSGLYVDLPAGWTMPPVPEAPTADEVTAARTLLIDDMLADFPFGAAADRAAAMAIMLTPVVRDMIDGPTPLLLVEAPVQGTGKGLLVEACLEVACGRPPASLTFAEDDAELQKRITAMLVGGSSICVLDNLVGAIGGAGSPAPALASALTQSVWGGRILGLSRDVRIPIRMTWVATANNASLVGDFPRRVVRCWLDAGVEAPQTRTGWRHSPLLPWVRANRAALLHAACVLVQAWIAAGRPAGPRTRGSYEAWGAVVGGILEVAGIPGLLEGAARTEDPETAAWRAFVGAWWGAHHGAAVRALTLLPLAIDHDLGLETVRGDADARASVLGRWLRARRDRVYGGLRLVDAGRADGQHQAWRVVEAGGAEPTVIDI